MRRTQLSARRGFADSSVPAAYNSEESSVSVPAFSHRTLGLVATTSALGGASWHLGTCLVSGAARMRFPLDIDWLEGGEIYHAWRLHGGLPIYRAATEGFLPFPYPPLYFAILAWMGTIFPIDFASGRALSLAAFVVTITTSGLAVALHAKTQSLVQRLVVAIVAGASVACTYANVEGYYDLARVDSLGIAFAVVAAFALLRGRWGTVVAGIAATAAIYTKQTMVFPVTALILAAWIDDRRRATLFAAIVVGLSSSALLGLQLATHGAFLRWITDLRHNTVVWSRLVRGPVRLTVVMPWLPLIPLVAAWLAGKRRLSSRARIWLFLWLGSLPAGLLPYAKEYGFVNNFIPIAATSGPAALLLALDLLDAASFRARAGLGIAWGAIFLAKTYDPERFRPSADAVARAHVLEQEIRGLSVDVLCPIHPLLVVHAGHPEEQAPLLSHLDAIGGKMGPSLESYLAYVLARRPDYVLFDDIPIEDFIKSGIASAYERDPSFDASRGPRSGSAAPFMPVPQSLYRRRR